MMWSRTHRSLALASGLVLACLALAGTARAQDYGGAGPNGASLSTTVLAPGGSFAVDCANPPCGDPGADARVGALSTLVVLGHMTVDANGGYHGTFNLPSNITPGAHTIVVDTTLHGAPVRYTTAITVTGALGTSILPKTGERIAFFVLLGLILIGIGAAMVTFARRRRAKKLAGASSEQPQRVPDPAARS